MLQNVLKCFQRDPSLCIESAGVIRAWCNCFFTGLKPSQEPQRLISSLWKVALTLGQVGVMCFVQTLWVLRQMESQDLKVTQLTGLQINMCLSKYLGRPNIVQGMWFWVRVFFFFFLVQNDKNTVPSILLDESESETISFGQLNMLLASIFLLENFGLFTSSIPWGALFWTAEKKSKNLQSYFLSDGKKKSVIKLMIFAMCCFLLWLQ